MTVPDQRSHGWPTTSESGWFEGAATPKECLEGIQPLIPHNCSGPKLSWRGQYVDAIGQSPEPLASSPTVSPHTRSRLAQ
jgi:hypothetical protein